MLQKVAQTITHEARGEDIVSRYGGEEFTLILGCDFQTAFLVAERLRSSVEERCSTFADARMYEAKRLGKNQVYTGNFVLDEAGLREEVLGGTGELGVVPG